MDPTITGAAFQSLRYIDERHMFHGDNRLAAVLRDMIRMATCRTLINPADLRLDGSVHRLALAMRLGNFNVNEIRRRLDRIRDHVPTNFDASRPFNSFERVLQLSQDLGLTSLDATDLSTRLLQVSTTAQLGDTFEPLLPRSVRFDDRVVVNANDPVNAGGAYTVRALRRLRQALSNTGDFEVGNSLLAERRQLASELRGAVTSVRNTSVYGAMSTAAPLPFLTFLIHRYPTAAVLFGTIVGASRGFDFQPFEALPWKEGVDEETKFMYISFFSRQGAYNQVLAGYNDVCNTRAPDGDIVIPQHYLRNCLAFNSAEELSRAIYMLLISVTSRDPRVKVLISFTTLTKRLVGPDQYSYRKVKFPTGNQSFSFGRSESLVDVYTTIVSGALQSLTGKSGNSNDVLADELVTITGLNYLIVQPNNQVFQYSQPNAVQLREQILWQVGHVRAFARGNPLKSFANKYCKTVPFIRDDGNCIAEAFVYYQIHRDYDNCPYDDRAKLGMIKGACQRALDEDLIQELKVHDGLLLKTLEALMCCERSWLTTDTVWLYLLKGVGYKPKVHECLKLVSREDASGWHVDYFISPTEDGLFDNEDELTILCYTQGHLFVSTHGQYVRHVSASVKLDERVQEALHVEYPSPFTLKSIKLEPVVADRRPAVPMDQAHPRARCNSFKGVYNDRYKIDKLSADFETDGCRLCSTSSSTTVQECYCAGVAWGTVPGQAMSFFGQECLRKAQEYTFDTFDGCVTQMLRWMKHSLGWVDTSDYHYKASDPVVRRFINFFNGSRFDTFFVYKSLTFWKEKVEIAVVNSDIITLRWGNFEFVDFAKRWPNCSLGECYALLSSQEVPGALPKPRASKWKCFPYLLIGVSCQEPDRQWMVEDFTEDVWGGKLIDGSAEATVRWWRENIGEFYSASAHLMEYCLDDVYVLQYLVSVEENTCKGVINGRLFDTGDCLTLSQAAMRYYQQAFLDEDIESPNLNVEMPTFTYANGLEATPSLQDIFDWSYKGGRVDVQRSSPINPARAEQWKEKFERDGTRLLVDEWDRNSMYPACMVDNVPIRVQSLEKFDVEQALDETRIVDTDLYHVRLKYPQGKSGIMIKVDGYCLSPSEIDYAYKCRTTKKVIQTWIWGQELLQALTEGVEIYTLAVVHFEAKAIFKNFVETLYNIRVTTTSALVKLIEKNKLNSTYGKLAQKPQPSLKLVYSIYDIYGLGKGDVLGIETLPGASEGSAMLCVLVYDSTRSWIGMFSFVSSFVTGKARASLAEFFVDYRKLPDMLGDACEECYSDTDSCKGIMPDWSSPQAAIFKEKHIHQTRLGAWKSESKGVGYVVAYFAARKLTAVHLASDPQASLQGFEIQVDALDPKYSIVKSKGVRHGSVRIKDVLAMLLGESVTFPQPDPFRRSLKDGVIKITNFSRTLKMHNLARQDPDQFGRCLPHKDVEMFRQHLDAKRIATIKAKVPSITLD